MKLRSHQNIIHFNIIAYHLKSTSSSGHERVQYYRQTMKFRAHKIK